MLSNVPLIVIIALVAIVLLFCYIAYKRMWRVAEPNAAMIISGFRRGKDNPQGFDIVTGRGTFIWPGQQVRTLDLSLHEAQLSSTCVTQQGIPVELRGVVIYKVGDDNASIANAARRFLGTKPDAWDRNIQNLFDGHLRSIIGGMTMEDLIRSRDKLTGETRDAAGIDMQKIGFIIDSLQIQQIEDPSGYIESLAAPHVAAVKKDARIAQAQADQDATQAEQTALANKSQYQRDTAVKQAQFLANQEAAAAQAAQAGPLAEATAKQDVVKAQTITAQLDASRKEQELQATVRKPADAAAYQLTVQAQAQATATKTVAEADGEAARLRGEGEAAASQAKLLAEATGMKARAEALTTNQEAVINQTIAEHMSEIIEKAAAPFGQIKNFTVLDGAQGVTRALATIAVGATTLLPLIRSALTAQKGDAKE